MRTRRLVAPVLLAAAVVAAPEQGSATQAGPRDCLEPPPCVHVTPDPGAVAKPGTVFVFRGRGWRQRSVVDAQYGEYCAPTALGCEDEGAGTRFRTDRRGRFVFRLRFARTLPRGTPRPAAAGGGQDSIRFRGRTAGGRGRSVERDAGPPPARSTRTLRGEVVVLSGAARRLVRALYPADGSVAASVRRYEQGLDACSAELERFKDADDDPRAQTMKGLIHLAFDAAVVRPILPELSTFAGEIERVLLDDPALRAGAEAWIAAIRRARPWPEPDLCTVVRQWRDTGYDPARAPVDGRAAQSAGFTDEIRVSETIRAAAWRLRALGAGPAIADEFGAGVIDLAALLGEKRRPGRESTS